MDIGIYATVIVLAAFNIFAFERGLEISKLIYEISNPKVIEKVNKRSKQIMLWAGINLILPTITFFLTLLSLSVGILFECNGIIIISSSVLLIYLLKCLNEFKSIKKFPIIYHLTAVFALMLAGFSFTFISSIIRGFLSPIYVIIASYIIFLTGVSLFIYVFYSFFHGMFTQKPEKNKEIEEQKRDWKEKIDN